MDKRKSERVQFFNIGDGEQVLPIWVFRKANTDAVLGLLVDISAEGVQVLADKAFPLADDLFQLSIHLDDDSVLTVPVKRQWSLEDESLYIRHGFTLEDSEENTATVVQRVIDAYEQAGRWMGCEIVILPIDELSLS